MALTDQQYYTDRDNWGGNQFALLKDIINNFMAFYVGDGKIINDVSRFDVVFHAKRALQELHYDALRDVRALELELPEDLNLELPKDFVRLIRMSWVDGQGKLRPLMVDPDSRIAKAYLQDDNYDIIFDSDGAATEGTTVIDLNINNASSAGSQYQLDYTDYDIFGGRFGMFTSKANVNGTFTLDKNLGYVRFSSEVKGKAVVIEYITDGFAYMEEDELKVNKLAEDFMYKYIAHNVIKHKFGVQEYIVRRLRNDEFAALKNMKIRMMDIHPFDLVHALKGRNKWIK